MPTIAGSNAKPAPAVVASFGGADLAISYVSGGVVLKSQGLSGDYDGNGMVDGGDFLAWQRGAAPGPVSAADLDYWAANLGYSDGSPANTAVPEPAAASIAATALGLLGLRRWSDFDLGATCSFDAEG